MDEHFELQPGQVDIWRLDLRAFQEPSRLLSYLPLLSLEERDRYHRFAFEPLHQNYLVAHALTRIILACYEAIPPSALDFTRNAFGRPELSHSQIGLRFNLSHTQAFAALAVAQTWDIGIDLECDDHPVSPLEIAERYFAPAEVTWLKAQPPERLKSTFLSLWSLKEAYIKACGLGLSMALDQIAVELTDLGPPRVAFSPGTDEAPDDWRLYSCRPTALCVLSVAVRCGALAEPQLALFELTSPSTGPIRLRPLTAGWA